MNGGMRAGDEADDEDLQRQRAGELRQQRVAGIDADDRDEDDEAEVLQDVARRVRRVAEEAQPRHDRRHDHARDQQAAGIAEADRGAECRELDRADQEAEDHAERQRQQVGRGAGTRDPAEHRRRRCSTAPFRPTTVTMSMRCSVVLVPIGIGTPPRSSFDTCNLAGDSGSGTHLRRRQLQCLLVGDEDLGLVERDVERLGDRRPPVRSGPSSRSCVSRRPPSAMTSPLAAASSSSVGPERLAAAHDVDDVVLGIGLAGSAPMVLPASRRSRAGRRAAPPGGSRSARRHRRWRRRAPSRIPWRPPWRRCPTSAAGTCRSG